MAIAEFTLPARRDAADTIAFNKLMAGWLSLADVWTAPADVATVGLSPAAGSDGTRLALLPTTDGFLTVELLTAAGYDDHLPADGIAVHQVTLVGTQITAITPLVGQAPFTALLQPGASLETTEWAITVGDDWAITVVPTQTR